MHACMFGVSGGGGGVGRTLGVQSQMLFLRDLCDVQLREQEREFAARVRSRYKQQKSEQSLQRRRWSELGNSLRHFGHTTSNCCKRCAAGTKKDGKRQDGDRQVADVCEQ